MPDRRPADPAPPNLTHLAFAYAHRGRVPAALGRAVAAIAGAVWVRHRFGDRDEFVAECFVYLLGDPMRAAAVVPDPADYLTFCAVWLGYEMRRRELVRRGREREYRAEVAEACRRSGRRR